MDIMPQADGSFLLEGSMLIREINKRINWDLPTQGPKTLSGLILETAQSWLLSKNEVSSVITGAKDAAQIKANSMATNWKLARHEIEKIETILS